MPCSINFENSLPTPPEPEYRIWRQDPEKVKEEMLSGAVISWEGSDYGANDFLIEFLKDSGLWETMTGLEKPKGLKMENGIPWEMMDQMMILKELTEAGKIPKVGKVIRDGKLMAFLGFNIERIQARKEEDKGVIHPDTFRNHLKRKDQEENLVDFYRHVKLLREKKWLRGGNYVADGFKIIVHGDGFEGAGEVWDPKTHSLVKGYKVVLLMNVEEDRERLVGLGIGAIQIDERDLLRKILADLKQHVCPPSEMIDLLILDRGFWGEAFLTEIKRKWRLDFLLIAKENLEIMKYEIPIVSEDLHWSERTVEVMDRHKHLKKKKIQIAKYEGIDFRIRRAKGFMTAVIVKEKGEKDRVFLTSLPVKEPLSIWKYYKERWVIENEGIRELSQRFKIRDLSGKTLNSITARMTLVLKIYNALKIFAMKFTKTWEELRETMRERAQESWLAGKGMIVYAGGWFATMTEALFGDLMRRRGGLDVVRALASRSPPEMRGQLEAWRKKLEG